MHQNAMTAGSVEPKGNGAAATVTKRMNDEIRFAGARIAVVIFHPEALQTTPWRPAQQQFFARRAFINQIAIKWDGQARKLRLSDHQKGMRANAKHDQFGSSLGCPEFIIPTGLWLLRDRENDIIHGINVLDGAEGALKDY